MLFRLNTVSLNMKRGYNFKTFVLNCDLALYTLLIDISFLLHNVITDSKTANNIMSAACWEFETAS